MAESTRLVDVVQQRIDQFLERQRPVLRTIAPDLDPFALFSSDLLRGGKRFRALFCYWGWQSVAGLDTGFDPLGTPPDARSLDSVMGASTALEFFHAAALVHDDIMDNSDTRRGLPSAHRRFERLHREGSWLGSAEDFGTSGALLMGDLLLAWSDELVSEAFDGLLSRDAARAARVEFNRMRTEVTVGQYLDILEENAWRTVPDIDLLPRAQRVIVYKSAKYSVEAPLTIGAAMAGGSPEALESLRHFGLPLGIAYQLRDDLLGVFGDPEVTGKPAGDDLREGKRTVLVAMARRSLPAGAVRLLDELLGDPELDDDQIAMLQATLRDSGAVDAVEQSISDQVERATHALDRSALSPSARAQLTRLADTVTRRTS
ncbi:polyprenyl synthetase family protein [Frigoribacterium sp. Leaf172]|uniref:polyprenyl synthetase family protein n=1 Tax=unclassified Frigoribacterium TaxID=2627005 RepID=UPI0006F67545|nr:polyprenyl synthetase family protein [Frigoribacterium sp. Leaf172]KQO82992.1 geranylgeranyl pyrophosphate synthase [Frigoribacterium sp. Leaf263]KQR64312.1 geranylgeranyl pyrophosphate synthase [Frigoribacterium sp. Leaf172]